ncbi:uncharacterized protein BJ171DRAFT_221328 [Polychytrium aggregatum]|uniref:uncharacterized protein n=1 Tax=Polychytrium aggregatum TaxID=110093 RepID=UPI0022FEB62B|nr:uncharacterized protein BJ171DRAFT_221328 [Polychytrium aggregatum]KAI9197475.1 hypothetical protein BJ171DRAFT_221328 [Polychytrium aggregatum]
MAREKHHPFEPTLSTTLQARQGYEQSRWLGRLRRHTGNVIHMLARVGRREREEGFPVGHRGFNRSFLQTSNEVCLSRSRLSHTRAASTSRGESFGLAWEYYRMGSKPRWFREADAMATEEQPSVNHRVCEGEGVGMRVRDRCGLAGQGGSVQSRIERHGRSVWIADCKDAC